MIYDYLSNFLDSFGVGSKDASLKEKVSKHQKRHVDLMRSYQQLCQDSFNSMVSATMKGDLKGIQNAHKTFLTELNKTLDSAFENNLDLASQTPERLAKVISFHQESYEKLLENFPATRQIKKQIDQHRVIKGSRKLALSTMTAALAAAALPTAGMASMAELPTTWEQKANRAHYGKEASFNHLAVYDIPSLHSKGLTGKGYTVSILEAGADIKHPTLTGKIEVIGHNTKFPQHGNHVSALIVGNATDQFDGGVAPAAKGYVIADQGFANDKSGYEKEMLGFFEEAAKRSHVINLSGGIGLKAIYDKSLSSDFVQGLQQILEAHDALLVITASNDSAIIGKSKDLRYLEDLIANEELTKRLLIVGNLGYEDQISLEKKEMMNRVGTPLLLQSLMDYAKQEDPSLKLARYWGNDLKQFLKSQNEDLAEFMTIAEVGGIFSADSQERIQQIIQRNEEDIDAEIKRVSQSSWQTDGFKDFLETSSLETFKENVTSIQNLLKTMPDLNNYRGEQEQYQRLFNYLKNLDIFENTHFLNAFEHWMGYLRTGWRDAEDFNLKIEAIRSTMEDASRRMPDDKNETGHVVSTEAGSAKHHFIMTYGENIRSAWNADKTRSWEREYENHTGSSQAAPITSGIILLLHQYHKEYLKQEKSWPEILRIVKDSTRPIGDHEVFGLGMLDTSRLFPEILPQVQ